MARVILPPKTWARQPHGVPRLDWSSPYTRGLVFCAVPYGHTFIDLVSGDVGTKTGALTRDRYVSGGASKKAAGSQAISAAGGTTDQVIWPVSTTRGGNLNATATLLALAATTQQVDGVIYPIGGNSEDVTTGAGFVLAIDSFNQVGRGNIIRLNYLDVLGVSSEAGGIGTDFDQQFHFFGYACSSNGAAGDFFAQRASTSWSGQTANGTTTTNRRAIILNNSNLSTTYAKRGSVALFLMYDRRLTLAEYQALYDDPWQIFAPQRRAIWVPSAGGGGATVAVPAGALTLTGLAPTVLTPRAVAVPAGSLTLTGFAPTVSTPRTVAVPLAQLTLTGFAPSVRTTGLVSVPVGNLTLTAFAPTVLTPRTVAVPSGSLTLTGFAPVVVTPRTITVPAGSLTLTGYAPAVNTGGSITVQVPAAALTLTGFAPSAVTPRTVAVPAGALTLSGLAPTILTPRTVAVPAGALTLTGLAPTVSTTANVVVQVPAGSLTLTGLAPTVIGTTVTPEVSGPTPAGRSRRKRERYIVEIDGEEFEVSSPDAAEALLQDAKDLARQRADEAIARAQKATKKPKPKILADARKSMPMPTIAASPDIQPAAQSTIAEIRGIYDDAMRVVEMMALMRRADQEEEEAVLLLLI